MIFDAMKHLRNHSRSDAFAAALICIAAYMGWYYLAAACFSYNVMIKLSAILVSLGQVIESNVRKS